jgi:outer membrane immunogenic protein
MHKLAIGIAAVLALIGPQALAANMAVKAPSPAATPALGWTGCYLGAEGGGVWGREAPVSTTAGTIGPEITSIRPNGGMFGGTVGCNYQAGTFVVGVEDDMSWAGLRGTGNDQPPFAAGFTHSVRSPWLDTLRGRGRVGVAVDRALIYATGGAAFTRIEDSAAGGGASVSQTIGATGWTAGGGVEYTVAPQWSVKAEYL